MLEVIALSQGLYNSQWKLAITKTLSEQLLVIHIISQPVNYVLYKIIFLMCINMLHDLVMAGWICICCNIMSDRARDNLLP